MLKRQLSLKATILIALSGILIAYYTASFVINNKVEAIEESTDSSIKYCKPNLVRMSGYEFINPILFLQDECEAKNLIPLKAQLENVIGAYKTTATITTASVYLRQLNQGDYISINESEKFNPGSLLKVPQLIAIMKMYEKDPSLLDKKITYAAPLVSDKRPAFLSKTIELGKSYTVRELLNYMVVYSDNNSALLLFDKLDIAVFKKVFTDLGLKEPDITKPDIPITAHEYSLFMRVLYNGSYLNFENSDFCTKLLSRSDFNKGLVSGLPKEVRIAHKFGEAADERNAHFSESGIIYGSKGPYILTVMLKGKDYNQLPVVVSDISRRVYTMLEQI